jgi:DNA-binding NtrC family response regulator
MKNKQPPAIHVLVVEDDDDERELLAMLLQRQGMGVRMAASVGDALDALECRRFDVVLADYNLPDGTGTEMLREAKRRAILNGAKAVLCTAQSYPMRDPDVGLLRKPLDLRRLLSEACGA